MVKKLLMAWWATITKREDNHDVQATGYTNDVFDSRVLHSCGLVTGVPNDTTVIALRMGAGKSNVVLLPMVAEPQTHMKAGETMVYATSADGQQVVACLKFTNDGKLALHTQTDDVLAIVQETLKLLQELQTFGPPTNHTPTPDWLAKAKVLEERLNSIAVYK